jgi:RNase H
VKNFKVKAGEMFAILEAIDVAKNHPAKQILIVSDSLSALKALSKYNFTESLTTIVRNAINDAEQEFTLLWIPSHVGIAGNDKADSLAKNSLTLHPKKWLTKTDALKYCNRKIWQKFQSLWDEEKPENLLKKIKPQITNKKTLNSLNRRDQMIITRLRIGHTRATHKYLFKTDKIKEKCNCNNDLTVDHILNNCKIFEKSRKKFKINVNTLKSDNSKDLIRIIKYLKEIKLYNDL